MEKKPREYAKNLLHWIKKYSWEENDARTQAELKLEINPFNGDGSVDECAKESLDCLTFDDIKWIVDAIASERIDVFQVDSLMFKYDGDLEEGVLEIEAGVHLAE